MHVLQSVDQVNELQKEVLFSKLQSAIPNGELAGETIALWGLSFKPNTDDMREAPSLVLIGKLLNAGCRVRVFDPIATEEAQKAIQRTIRSSLSDNIYYASDIYDTVNDADALMLVTEWKEFRMPNWDIVRKLMKNHLVLDGRNIYDKKELSEMGFTYLGVGV